MRVLFGVVVAALALWPAHPLKGNEFFYTLSGDVALPPAGWVEFCERLPDDCTAAAVPAQYVLTPGSWKELTAVNRKVNRKVLPEEDLPHYGVKEYWTYPDDGYGDCEDYVLLKRRMLMMMGWPSSTLLISIVVDKNGDGHAVLTVRTDRGDFVLDNMHDSVVLWSEAPYRYNKLQSQENPNEWVRIRQDPPAVGSLRRR